MYLTKLEKIIVVCIIAVSLAIIFSAVRADAEPVLGWGASERADGYELHYGVVGGGDKAVRDVGDVLTFDTAELDNIVPGGLYGFFVKAYNAAGASEPSNSVATVVKEGYAPIEIPLPPITLTTPSQVIISITVSP